MARVRSVFANAGEDFVDEASTLIVHEHANSFYKKVMEKLNLNPETVVGQALEGSLMTFKMGMMNTVIILVTEYVITKIVAIGTFIFAFIKTRRIVKQSVQTFSSIVGNFGVFGYGASKAIDGASNILIGNQNETLALAKMTNDSANNIVSAIGQERQNQIMIRKTKLDRVDNEKKLAFSNRNTYRTKNMELYIHKMKTGTWKDDKYDKRLYFDCTGQDSKTVPFNSSFVSQLNKFSEYVKTAEGEIFNECKATIDLLAIAGQKIV